VSHKYIYGLVVLLFAFLSRALVSYWPWTSRSLLRFDGGSIKCVQWQRDVCDEMLTKLSDSIRRFLLMFLDKECMILVELRCLYGPPSATGKRRPGKKSLVGLGHGPCDNKVVHALRAL
jgi:hypothetical protein